MGLADLLNFCSATVSPGFLSGWCLPGELAVGLLDRGLVGVPGDAEDLVEVRLEPVLTAVVGASLLRCAGIVG